LRPLGLPGAPRPASTCGYLQQRRTAPRRTAPPRLGTSPAQTSPDGAVTSVSVPRLRHSVGRMDLADWAANTARYILETTLPRRWAHSQGVASQARSLARILGRNADLLEAAAWLHDVGYAAHLAVTGFHQMDGALYLRDTARAPDVLCRLVAHHSCAIIEAEELSIADQLSREFQPVRRDLTEALTYCDMTTGPDGQRLPVGQRLAEIRTRYGPGHVVSRAIGRSAPRITEAVTVVERRLADGVPVRRVPRVAVLAGAV
jgi:putative nucleotidyltransferase with HDIG domain